MSTATCKHCGSDRYEIRFIYMGQRQKLLSVHCGECGSEFSPVVVDYFAPDNEINLACESAWNSANATKSEVLRINGLTAESAEQREQANLYANSDQIKEVLAGNLGSIDVWPREGMNHPTWGTVGSGFYDTPIYITPPAPSAGMPDEATPAMLEAYGRVLAMGSELDGAMVWRAMLSAAPQPAAQTQEREAGE